MRPYLEVPQYMLANTCVHTFHDYCVYLHSLSLSRVVADEQLPVSMVKWAINCWIYDNTLLCSSLLSLCCSSLYSVQYSCWALSTAHFTDFMLWVDTGWVCLTHSRLIAVHQPQLWIVKQWTHNGSVLIRGSTVCVLAPWRSSANGASVLQSLPQGIEFAVLDSARVSRNNDESCWSV